MHYRKRSLALALSLTAGLSVITACSGDTEKSAGGIEPKKFTDALFAVMEADRTVYTQKVVQRLANQEKVISASEHWNDEKALPLPAQMFRFGSEMVGEKTDEFSYTLQSLWPINKQNAPVTDIEKEGLNYIVDNPGENFYGTEELGGVSYFTAVYPDVAVSPACVSCHNDHRDTPRTDFKLGDVMGGVVIRVPLD